MFLVFFFFSSRRRHTRCSRDWSSDVCSSDLAADRPHAAGPQGGRGLISGVALVAKPAGPTSHDVVEQVRRALGTDRVGHLGTLDPFAVGLLVILAGRATRLASYAAAWTKSYEGGSRLGVGTTTRSEERRVGKECRSRWSPDH